MNNILGYFGEKKGEPFAYMNKAGLVIFSNNKKLKAYKNLGGYREMNKILCNLDYYNIQKGLLNSQSGGGGLFGESQGSCGWGNNPSCCFFSCAPMWRTSLWPINNDIM
jgi:hypothetical protein